MYRDDDSSHAPDQRHAMVSEAHPGDALMVQGNGAPTGLTIAAPPVAPAQDVLRGGMDANSLMHALRRRWLLALCIGSLVGASTAIALWLLFPESSSAVALFEVSNEQQSLLRDKNQHTPQDFDILKKTQLALLKSNFVLTAALRDPGIASLSILAGEPEPVEWLQEELVVDFPQNGEILSISLSGDAPTEDLQRLVDAVAKAYKEEVLGQEQQRQTATLDLLNRSLDTLNSDIQRDWQEYVDIAREADRPNSGERDAKTELLLREISEDQANKVKLTTDLYRAQTDYIIMKGEISDPQMLEQQVEEELLKDVTMLALQDKLNNLLIQQVATNGSSRRANSRAANTLQRQIDAMKQQIAQYREQVKQQKIRENESKPNLALGTLMRRFKTEAGSLKSQLDAVNSSLEEKMTQLKERMSGSVDLETRQRKLEQLQEIANDMNLKRESLEIDAKAPPQIRQVQAAVPMKGINTAEHYSIAALGGIGTFALTCLAIGYLEFRNRRLNGPDDVDEGLGIRVVGTLPSLSSRGALDPNHPIVAQLTESIDGVRTILMHDSTSKKRQVVLVTSPATMEGRTTVASQLAASLARAGRRTLLIDGDLRRPALQALFDVPLEDGLCEVLRAEVDVSDVIRPTHAEGLWLLTAGYCDIDAIHALATEQMQPVFDKLRAEYDFVIIDGAPVLGMSDALIFGQYSDGAILSVRRDHSQTPKINQAAALLRGVGIRIIGAVVNGVQAKADDRIIQMRLIAPKSERELQPTA
jgi:polysaccharide biosynthesis transport protein